MKRNGIVKNLIECSSLPQRNTTSETASLSSCCIMCYCFIMPAPSLCVIVQIDSLHICCQGHHQGLMNERWKKQKWSSRGKERALHHHHHHHHTCKPLISLLPSQSSAAGTGFNSSARYYRAAAAVNLDYPPFLLTNPSIILVQELGNQIVTKSRPVGFTWSVLDLSRCPEWTQDSHGMSTTATAKDLILASQFWLLSVNGCKCSVLDVSAEPAND